MPTKTSPSLQPHNRRIGGWFLLGLLMVASAFAYLERTQRFYFTQDDALVAELPGMIAGCRSVWNGIRPDYDPCRLMGGPLASEGLFSLTYPPTYLCYAIARHVLHNEYATFEVFALLHLLVGYCITYYLFRRRDIAPMIACCASLSFVLSGSILIMGRSWHTYLALVVWMPLLVIATDRLREGGRIGVGWAMGTGIVGGILYHVGFPQMWVYAMLFLSFAIVWLLAMKQIDWRRAVLAAAAGLIALGVAAPLLVPQLILARYMERPPIYGSGLTYHWIAALLPYPLIKVEHPMFWGSTDLQYMGQFVYFGTTFAVLFLLAIIAMGRARPLRQSLGQHVWTACAILAALLSMGKAGGVFYLLSKLPLVATVNNNPFRALPFFVLFAVIGGASFANHAIIANERVRKLAPIIACLTIGLLGYHVCMARASFYTYGFRPYPPLEPALAKHLKGQGTGRMISWSPQRSISPKLATAIPHDLPLIYGLPAFDGYDPVLEHSASFIEIDRRFTESPLQAARAYGIRWQVISKLMLDPVLSPNVHQNDLEQATRYRGSFDAIHAESKYIAHADGVDLAELSGVAPMSFPKDKPDFYLPLTADGHGITVQLARWHTEGDIIVNYAWFPQFRATVNGKHVEVTHDEWQRIVVHVPAGAKTLEITYAPGWMKGIAGGLALIALAILLQLASRACQRRIH